MMPRIAFAALAAVLVAAGGALGGWQARAVLADRDVAELRAAHAKEREAYAQAAQRAEAAARETERQRVEKLAEIEHESAKRTRDLQNDAARARRAADSLRDHIARLAASDSTASDSGTATSGETATGPGLVLSELFSRTLDRTVELAEYADRARAAGLACEAAYATLRQ